MSAQDPTELVVAVLITHEATVLLGRNAPGAEDTAHSVPMTSLQSGETLCAAAERVSTELGAGPVESTSLQTIACVEDSARRVFLALSAIVAEVPQAPEDGAWAFFPVQALPDSLDPASDRIIASCRVGSTGTDFDGRALDMPAPPPVAGPAPVVGPSPVAGPVGAGAAPESLLSSDAAGDAAPLPQTGLGRAFAHAALCAGVVLWTAGILFALREARTISRRDLEMGLLVFPLAAVVIGQVFCQRHAPKARGINTAGSIISGILLGGVLLVGFVALTAGLAIDDDRAAFWLWAFGALCAAPAARKILKHSPTGSKIPSRARVAIWLAVSAVSFATVFAPLRSGLGDAFDTKKSKSAVKSRVEKDPFKYDR